MISVDIFGEDVDSARCATLGIAARYEKEVGRATAKAKEQVEFSWECWRLDSHLSFSNPDHIFMLAFLTNICLYTLYYLDRPPLSSA
jgi:hypothetical protein